MMRKLTNDECLYATKNGDFSPETKSSAAKTVIIMTQSWCPQWKVMEMYMGAVEKKIAASASGDSVELLYVEYDKEPFYEEFVHFKETVLKNFEIPYLRFYKNGELTSESNYVSETELLFRLGIGEK
ncbi:hypothetical protein K7I13_06675 [Brucepastera parasyntrophica]|uniref:hypothetical protein n=1 Tax=Brucepastera parasyntrophica TaxID=2880008 RepID=UPI002109BD84|nr:hypothetical protein [Brucepastera parasyntrophica]ULQ60934.1 hypothetical protein K7I13_06675 [Brucepastera parasyntrophica]